MTSCNTRAISAPREDAFQAWAEAPSRSQADRSSNPTCTMGSGSLPSTQCGQMLRIRYWDKLSYRPPSRCANARQSFQSEAAQKVTLARSSQSNELLFPLSQIDFSSSSVNGTVALHQPEPVASPTIEWLRETKTARSGINNRLADAQRGRSRRRRNVEDMQHFTGRHELEIVHQSSVGLQGLGAHA